MWQAESSEGWVEENVYIVRDVRMKKSLHGLIFGGEKPSKSRVCDETEAQISQREGSNTRGSSNVYHVVWDVVD